MEPQVQINSQAVHDEARSSVRLGETSHIKKKSFRVFMVNIFMTYFSIGLKLSPIQELLEELVHMPFCKLMTFF